MAMLIEVKEISDERGQLVVLQDQLPFQIQRVFYIYGVGPDKRRGGHRHKKTHMALVVLHGHCTVSVNNGIVKNEFKLNRPNSLLYLMPEDFHYMYNFSNDCVLLVLASTKYDKDDYILQDYDND